MILFLAFIAITVEYAGVFYLIQWAIKSYEKETVERTKQSEDMLYQAIAEWRQHNDK